MADLCQLSDVKDWLGITQDDTGADTTLSRLITALSADFLTEIKRPDLVPATDYVELRSGNGSQEIFVNHYPLNSIASVTINDIAIPASPDDGISDGYWFTKSNDPENRIKISLTGFWFSRGRTNRVGEWGFTPWHEPRPLQNVVLAYNGGYGTTVPVTDEIVTVPAAPGPYTITVAQASGFSSDTGVVYVLTGLALGKVSSNPTQGQYAVDANGNYTFNALDTGLQVNISYQLLQDIPFDVTQAVIEWVAYRYRQRGWIGQSSKHMAQGETVSFQNVRMPDYTCGVVNKYTRMNFGE